MRGVRDRKRLLELGESDSSIDDSCLFVNPIVKKVYDAEGPYSYPDVRNLPELTSERPPFRLLNGAIYLG